MLTNSLISISILLIRYNIFAVFIPIAAVTTHEKINETDSSLLENSESYDSDSELSQKNKKRMNAIQFQYIQNEIKNIKDMIKSLSDKLDGHISKNNNEIEDQIGVESEKNNIDDTRSLDKKENSDANVNKNFSEEIKNEIDEHKVDHKNILDDLLKIGKSDFEKNNEMEDVKKDIKIDTDFYDTFKDKLTNDINDKKESVNVTDKPKSRGNKKPKIKKEDKKPLYTTNASNELFKDINMDNGWFKKYIDKYKNNQTSKRKKPRRERNMGFF